MSIDSARMLEGNDVMYGRLEVKDLLKHTDAKLARREFSTIDLRHSGNEWMIYPLLSVMALLQRNRPSQRDDCLRTPKWQNNP